MTKRFNKDVISSHLHAGAEPHCPLGGPWSLQKKKKGPPAYIEILIGAPNDVHLAPPPIPVQFTPRPQHAPVSIVGLFYLLIKQNMAPLYLNTQRHYPTK